MTSLQTDAPITPLRQRMQQDMVMRGWDPIRSMIMFDMSVALPLSLGVLPTPRSPRTSGITSCTSMRTAWGQPRSTARFRRSAAQSAVVDGDRDLFQALRQKRTEMARAQNVPPYVIFHDKTLIELAAVRPASRAEMADVPGIGEAKLDRYGPAFLAVIAEHVLRCPMSAQRA